mmetsp:Transcript_23402/g.70399  ORF Transcript_23402/g.70399 Transcript_23402/m.70399 type:complete len:245 (+) Transcript_23402:1094-1828(+)
MGTFLSRDPARTYEYKCPSFSEPSRTKNAQVKRTRPDHPTYLIRFSEKSATNAATAARTASEYAATAASSAASRGLDSDGEELFRRKRASYWPSVIEDETSGMWSVPLIVVAPGPGGASPGSRHSTDKSATYSKMCRARPRETTSDASPVSFFTDVVFTERPSVTEDTSRSASRSASSAQPFMSRSSKVVPAAFHADPSPLESGDGAAPPSSFFGACCAASNWAVVWSGTFVKYDVRRPSASVL